MTCRVPIAVIVLLVSCRVIKVDEIILAFLLFVPSSPRHAAPEVTGRRMGEQMRVLGYFLIFN